MGLSIYGPALSSGEVVTFALLSAAVIALWVPGRGAGAQLLAAPSLAAPSLAAPSLVAPWLALLTVATASAGWFGYLGFRGLAALVLLAVLSYAAHRARLGRAARVVSVAGLLIVAAGLMLHLLPGFANPKVISGEVLTPGALPYTKYLNFDKTAVGILLLGFGWRMLGSWGEWREMLRRIVPVVLTLFAVVLPLALALGHVRFEPALRSHLLLWAWTNLFFTCVAEEALFRGFIQRRLTRALTRHRFGAELGLGIAALLFGLAHLAGGWSYVLLSTVAGLGYGWAMRRSGRIEAAILTHFLVNSLHFGFFTYPALPVQ